SSVSLYGSIENPEVATAGPRGRGVEPFSHRRKSLKLQRILAGARAVHDGPARNCVVGGRGDGYDCWEDRLKTQISRESGRSALDLGLPFVLSLDHRWRFPRPV